MLALSGAQRYIYVINGAARSGAENGETKMNATASIYESDADKMYFAALVTSVYGKTAAERDAAARDLPALKAARDAARK